MSEGAGPSHASPFLIPRVASVGSAGGAGSEQRPDGAEEGQEVVAGFLETCPAGPGDDC